MKIFQLVCLLAAALASTSVHALDGGPASGGGMSVNPNNRAPRTESAGADGGPMAGSSMSVNPNARTPAPADGGPATTGTDDGSTPAPVTTKPAATSAPAGPPMSGGDLSTNPNSRTRAPSATTAAPSTTAPPAATTTPPATTTPSLTPSVTVAPSSSGSQGGSGVETSKSPASTEPAEFDFSLINGDDKSAANDVIGEVSPNRRANSSGGPAASVEAEIGGEADLPAEKAKEASEPSAPAATAATPSPVSKKKAVNTGGISSATRMASASMSGLALATTAAAVVLAAL